MEIQNQLKKFSQADSVLVFNISDTCSIQWFGYAKKEETDIAII